MTGTDSDYELYEQVGVGDGFFPNAGDEILVSVLDDAGLRIVEQLKQLGLTVAASSPEGTAVLLQSVQESDEEEPQIDEDAQQRVTVEPQLIPRQPKKLKARPTQGPPSEEWNWADDLVGVVSTEKQFAVALGNLIQDPFVEIFFLPAFSRGANATVLRLMLDSVAFGVENCVNKNDLRAYFVYQIDIKVDPSAEWSEGCICTLVWPDAASSSNVTQLQHTGAHTLQATVSPIPTSNTLQYSYNRGSQVSETLPKHGWKSTVSGRVSKSVTWTWAIYMWEDGQKFHAEDPANLDWLPTDIPPLPVDDPSRLQFSFPDFRAEATWHLPRGSLEGMHAVKWDITVTLHTANVQRQRRGIVYIKCKAKRQRFQFASTVNLPLV